VQITGAASIGTAEAKAPGPQQTPNHILTAGPRVPSVFSFLIFVVVVLAILLYRMRKVSGHGYESRSRWRWVAATLLVYLLAHMFQDLPRP
jgi:hypothetical protein